jgi:hypothetical protein
VRRAPSVFNPGLGAKVANSVQSLGEKVGSVDRYTLQVSTVLGGSVGVVKPLAFCLGASGTTFKTSVYPEVRRSISRTIDLSQSLLNGSPRS